MTGHPWHRQGVPQLVASHATWEGCQTLTEEWGARVTASMVTNPRNHICSECLGWKSLVRAREVSQASPRPRESQASIIRNQSSSPWV